MTHETYYITLFRDKDLTIMWFFYKQFSHYLYVVYEQIVWERCSILVLRDKPETLFLHDLIITNFDKY